MESFPEAVLLSSTHGQGLSLTQEEVDAIHSDRSGELAASVFFATTAAIDATTIALNTAATSASLAPSFERAAEVMGTLEREWAEESKKRAEAALKERLLKGKPGFAASLSSSTSSISSSAAGGASSSSAAVGVPSSGVALGARFGVLTTILRLLATPFTPFWTASRALFSLLFVGPLMAVWSSLLQAKAWSLQRVNDALALQFQPYDPRRETLLWVNKPATDAKARENRKQVILASLASALPASSSSSSSTTSSSVLRVPDCAPSAVAGGSDPLLSASNLSLQQLVGAAPIDQATAAAASRRIQETIIPDSSRDSFTSAALNAGNAAAAAAILHGARKKTASATASTNTTPAAELAAAVASSSLADEGSDYDDNGSSSRMSQGRGGPATGADDGDLGGGAAFIERLYVLPSHAKKAAVMAVCFVGLPLTLALLSYAWSQQMQQVHSAPANTTHAASPPASHYQHNQHYQQSHLYNRGPVQEQDAASSSPSLFFSALSFLWSAAWLPASVFFSSSHFVLNALLAAIVKLTGATEGFWRFLGTIAFVTLFAWALLATPGVLRLRARVGPGDDTSAVYALTDLAFAAAAQVGEETMKMTSAGTATVDASAMAAHPSSPSSPSLFLSPVAAYRLRRQLRLTAAVARRAFPRIWREKSDSAARLVPTLMLRAIISALLAVIAGVIAVVCAAVTTILSLVASLLSHAVSTLMLSQWPAFASALVSGAGWFLWVCWQLLAFGLKTGLVYLTWGLQFVAFGLTLGFVGGVPEQQQTAAAGSSKPRLVAPPMPSLATLLDAFWRTLGGSGPNPFGFFTSGSLSLQLCARSPAAQTAALLGNVRAVAAAVDTLTDALVSAPSSSVAAASIAPAAPALGATGGFGGSTTRGGLGSTAFFAATIGNGNATNSGGLAGTSTATSVVQPFVLPAVTSILSCLAALGGYLASPRYLAAPSAWTGLSSASSVSGNEFLPATAWSNGQDDGESAFAAAQLVEAVAIANTNGGAGAAAAAAGAAKATLDRLRGNSGMLLRDGSSVLNGEAPIPGSRHLRPATAVLQHSLIASLRRIRQAMPKTFDGSVVPRLPSPVLQAVAARLMDAGVI